MPSDLPPAPTPAGVPPAGDEMRVLLLPPTSRDGEAIRKLLIGAGIACVVCPTTAALGAEIDRGAGAAVVSEESLTTEAGVLAARVGSQPVWSDLPVLVLSRVGAESPRLAPNLARLGNVSVVERPVRVTTLLSLVRSALRARARQYEMRAHLGELASKGQALQESERRFRDMADTAPAILWITEADGYCSFLSRGWYELTGQAESEGLGLGWTDAIHPDDRAIGRSAFLAANEARQSYAVDFRVRRADGEYRWVIDAGRPRFGPNGEFFGFIGSVIDITDRKSAEEERHALFEAERIARTEAERASQMKDDFLATLSHEIRTPLNAILGWSQIIRGPHAKPTDVMEGAEIIERNARVQTQIIEDLLDMSRIISGKLRLDVQRIGLADVIRAAAETVGPAASAKDIRLQLVLDPHAGPVSGDPNRLQQVLWNLLSNAIKFTPKGGRVQVLLERINSHLEISVIDTGEGIAPEFLAHVFDRFRQADASTTRRHGGLGLGLAIVKQLVELHGGTILAKSPGVGRGSTFVVSLPLTIIHPDPEPQPERRHPTANSMPVAVDSCVQITGVRVLVIDDEPDSRVLLRRLLEDCKAFVMTAASAAEGFELLKAERPDVMVSDIGMPGEDGYSLIRRVRALGAEHGGQTPAIALTAYARADDRVRAVVAGFQHHVAKPVEPAELIAMVASVSPRAS